MGTCSGPAFESRVGSFRFWFTPWQPRLDCRRDNGLGKWNSHSDRTQCAPADKQGVGKTPVRVMDVSRRQVCPWEFSCIRESRLRVTTGERSLP